jgi:arylsulfatase A-like enzyme
MVIRAMVSSSQRFSRHLIPLGLVALAACDGSSDKGVRVVMITLDTLRLDSFAGGESESMMPLTLERAGRGLVFERHYATSSTTLPTHASMFTGLHPWEHGITANGLTLGPERETVAELLEEAGFATAAVVASYPLHNKHGFDQGFDVYHNEFGSGDPDEERDNDQHSTADRINQRVFEVLDTIEGQKQFLWFHYFDAHAPYGDTENAASNYFPNVLAKRIHSTPDERDYILSRSRELYDTDVRSMDVMLQAVFDRLEADSEQWETHVLVVSDHGEAFGEGGAMGHGKRLTGVQIHVPLFILSPRVEPGVSRRPVGSVDVAATLLAMAGVEHDLPHGDDLTRSLDPDRRVLGMRRRYEKPHEEFRIDGTLHMLDEHWFYSVQDGEVLVGNADRIMRGDTEAKVADPAVAGPLQREFGGYQEALEVLPKVELDEKSKRALEQLGYTGQ